MIYELSGKEKEVVVEGETIKVFQIKSLKPIADFNIDAGCIGGWVESIESLSNALDSWIDETSVVLKNSKIGDNTIIKNFSIVYGRSVLTNGTVVSNSVVKNIKIGKTGALKIFNSICVAEKSSKFHSLLECENSNIRPKSIDINRRTSFQYVEGENFIVNSNGYLTLKNVSFETGSYLTSLENNNYILGSEKKEVSIKTGTSLIMSKTTIEGSGKLDGKINLKSSKIEGKFIIENKNRKDLLIDFSTFYGNISIRQGSGKHLLELKRLIVGNPQINQSNKKYLKSQ